MPYQRAREFGEWLSRELRDRKIVAAQFARQVGTSSASVSRWMNGLSFPDPPNCIAIARVLDLSPDLVLAKAGHRADAQTARQYDVAVTLEQIRNLLEGIQPEVHACITQVPILNVNHGGAFGYVPRTFVEELEDPALLFVADDSLASRGLHASRSAVLLDRALDPKAGDVVVYEGDDELYYAREWQPEGEDALLASDGAEAVRESEQSWQRAGVAVYAFNAERLRGDA